jgi:translocation and assembly module TamB
VRLALSVHDGVWLFTPRFKGRILGEITAACVCAPPQNRWPARRRSTGRRCAGAGGRHRHLERLGAHRAGAWPANCAPRPGSAAASAEPRYHGEITGSGLAVRNLLAGVNVSNGQIDAAAGRRQRRIERFTLRGGEGSLT